MTTPELLAACKNHIDCMEAAGFRTAARDLRALVAEYERVSEVLARVGVHPSTCPKGIGIGYYRPPPSAICTCGLEPR